MKGILKLAVFGIEISAFVSCQKNEPQITQSWPEWFETATQFNKNFVDVLFFAGTNIETEFDRGVTVSFNSAASREDIWYDIYANTHYCINPVNWKTDDTPATFKYDGMELTNHVDPETHVLLVDGFDFVTHPSVLPGCSPRWPEHNLHVYEVRMYAPYLRKNIKDRAYRSVH